MILTRASVGLSVWASLWLTRLRLAPFARLRLDRAPTQALAAGLALLSPSTQTLTHFFFHLRLPHFRLPVGHLTSLRTSGTLGSFAADFGRECTAEGSPGRVRGVMGGSAGAEGEGEGGADGGAAV